MLIGEKNLTFSAYNGCVLMLVVVLFTVNYIVYSFHSQGKNVHKVGVKTVILASKESCTQIVSLKFQEFLSSAHGCFAHCNVNADNNFLFIYVNNSSNQIYFYKMT